MLEDRAQAMDERCIEREREKGILTERLSETERLSAQTEKEFAAFRKENGQEIDGLMAEFDQLREQLIRADAAKESLEKRLAEAHADIADARGDADERTKGMRDAEMAAFEALTELQRAERDNDTERKRGFRIQKDLECESQRRALAEDELSAVKKDRARLQQDSNDFSERLRGKEETCERLQDELRGLRLQITSEHDSLTELQGKCDTLQKRVKDLEMECEGKHRLVLLCEDQLQELHGVSCAFAGACDRDHLITSHCEDYDQIV